SAGETSASGSPSTGRRPGSRRLVKKSLKLAYGTLSYSLISMPFFLIKPTIMLTEQGDDIQAPASFDTAGLVITASASLPGSPPSYKSICAAAGRETVTLPSDSTVNCFSVTFFNKLSPRFTAVYVCARHGGGAAPAEYIL